MNGINYAFHRLFVEDIVGTITRFTKDGPAWLMRMVVTPYWFLAGYGDREKKEKLYQVTRSGSLPIGFAALFVLIYLGILFFL